MYQSTNNGQNWTQANSGLSNLGIESIVMNQVGHVFVATRGGGVFRSTNNGDQWLPMSGGLTDLDVRCLGVNEDGFIFAGTGTQGVYKSIRSTTSVSTSLEKPALFELYQNYPNPLNPSTTILFRLPSGLRDEGSSVTLQVHDLLGREVATLVNARLLSGEHSVVFDASGLASGLYLYKLSVERASQQRAMLLVR